MITIEEAKQELEDVRKDLTHIRDMNDDVIEMRELLVSTTRRLSPTKPSNNSMSSDKFSDGLSKVSEVENDIDKRLSDLMVKKYVVTNKIEQLDYPYRDVLYKRYIRGKRWEEIRDEMKYDSVRRIYQLKDEAIEKYANL